MVIVASAHLAQTGAVRGCLNTLRNQATRDGLLVRALSSVGNQFT